MHTFIFTLAHTRSCQELPRSADWLAHKSNASAHRLQLIICPWLQCCIVKIIPVSNIAYALLVHKLKICNGLEDLL